MPSVVRQDLDNCHAILTITAKREEIKPKIDSELKRFRQKASIKGFRAGQAPMQYVKQLYGTAIFADTVNDLISKALYDYLREQNLNVLGQPLPTEDQKKYSFKVDNPEEEYSISYEIGHVPKFEINGLGSDQSYERLTISNLDALADEDLEYARKRMGKRTNPENDILENDILRIASKEEGGDWETTITVFVKNVADETLKNQLLGMKKGDSLRFNVRAVENFSDEKLLRKYLLNIPDGDERPVGDWFNGTIEEVSRVEMADMNSEFFEGYFGGQVSSPEEAHDVVKAGIAQFYNVRANALLMREFQKRLIDLNQFPVPETFLKKWLRVSNKEQNLSPETIEKEMPAFLNSLRWSMIQDELNERFDVFVSDKDIHDAYAQKVREYFKANLPDHLMESSVKRLMQNKKDVQETAKQLEVDKLFAAIRDNVQVTERAVSSDDFHKILDEVTAKAEAEQATAL